MHGDLNKLTITVVIFRKKKKKSTREHITDIYLVKNYHYI